MDSDGEDLPSTIENLLKELTRPEIDVAVAVRSKRVQTLKFKAFYLIYKFLFKIATGRTINFGNFMALKPQVISRLLAMQELSLHIAGTVLASRLRIAHCEIDRGPRYSGSSKMNFVGLLLHGFKGLMVFAEDVLVRVGIACAVTALLTTIFALLASTLKILGISTPGWFSIALGILFLTFLQTIVLSLIALISLMLTGVIRSGNPQLSKLDQDAIECISTTSNFTLPKPDTIADTLPTTYIRQ
jgi:hypothetical protein